MMKKLISLVLAFVLCVSLVPASAFAEDEVPEENAIEESSVEEVEMVDSIVEDEETESVEQKMPGAENADETAEEPETPLNEETVELEESTSEETVEIIESEDDCLVEETTAPSIGDDGTASDDYTQWRQSDSAWNQAEAWPASEYPSATLHKMSEAGCLVTSIAMLLRHYGVVAESSVNNFNPWICNEKLKAAGAFNSAADLMWSCVANAYPGFVYQGSVSYSASNLVNYYNQGYACVVAVNNYGHYVAVKTASSSSNIVIMDPGWGYTSLSSFGSVNCIYYFKCTPETPVDHTPGKTTVSVQQTATTTGAKVAFTWASTTNTTHYNIWVYKKDDSGNWNSVDHTFKVNSGYSLSLTPGEYRAMVQSYNSNYYKSDGSDWLYTESDYCYFTVCLKECSINYTNVSGGTLLSETVPSGSATLSTIYPTKSGSYFCGWSYTSGGTTIDVRPGDTITVSANVNLYPIFVTHEEAISGKAVPIYNIKDFTTSGYTATQADVTWTTTVDNSYWSDWSAYSTTAVTASSTVQVRTTTMYRYYYFYCPSCGGHEPFQGASDCHNYTLSGSNWVEKYFTTAYKDSNYQSFSYTSDKYYTESLGDGQRWCFSAGNLNDTAVGTVDTDSAATVITTGYSSRTWVEKKSEQKHTVSGYIITQSTPVTYTVTYDAAGGTGAPEEQIKTQGVDLKLSEVEPTWEGFTFLGWDTNTYEDVLEPTIKYNPGDTYSGNADITLYAVWSDGTDVLEVLSDNEEIWKWTLYADGSLVLEEGTGLYSDTGGRAFDEKYSSRVKKVIIGADVDTNPNVTNLLCRIKNVENVTVDSENKYYCAVDGVLFSASMDTLLYYPPKKSGSTYTTPSGVKTIGVNAFAGCSQLASIAFSDGVETINSLLENDVNLSSVSIPTSMKCISGCAFKNCTGLKTVYYAGTEEQWDAITIEEYNDPLTSANIIFATVDTDAPTLTTESKTVCPGQSFTVTVSVANNPGIMAMILTPVYDANVMTLDSVDNGTVFSSAPEQGKNLTWLGDVDTDQDGTLLTYHFTVKEDAAEGNYTVGVSSVTSSDESENPVTFTVTNGTVTVKSIVYGDATGDGEVNIFDLVRLKKYLANYDSDTQTSTIAISGGGDATGNGTIDIFDLVRLKKYLANYDADTKTSTVALGPTE